jgi:hypothetical protein
MTTRPTGTQLLERTGIRHSDGPGRTPRREIAHIRGNLVLREKLVNVARGDDETARIDELDVSQFRVLLELFDEGVAQPRALDRELILGERDFARNGDVLGDRLALEPCLREPPADLERLTIEENRPEECDEPEEAEGSPQRELETERRGPPEPHERGEERRVCSRHARALRHVEPIASRGRRVAE